MAQKSLQTTAIECEWKGRLLRGAFCREVH